MWFFYLFGYEVDVLVVDCDVEVFWFLGVEYCEGEL